MEIKQFINRVREYTGTATAEPWNIKWLSGAIRHVTRNVERDCFVDDSDVPENENYPTRSNYYSDAYFIASSRTDLPKALEIIEQQAKEIEDLELKLERVEIRFKEARRLLEIRNRYP